MIEARRFERKNTTIMVDQLDWKSFQMRGLATTIADLPPQREGIIRGTHYTKPKNVNGILTRGLRYTKQGSAYWTVLEWTYEDRERIEFIDIDNPKRHGRGTVTIVLDLTPEEWDMHISKDSHPPGVISPNHIVGIIDGWGEYDRSRDT